MDQYNFITHDYYSFKEARIAETQYFKIGPTQNVDLEGRMDPRLMQCNCYMFSVFEWYLSCISVVFDQAFSARTRNFNPSQSSGMVQIGRKAPAGSLDCTIAQLRDVCIVRPVVFSMKSMTIATTLNTKYNIINECYTLHTRLCR